MNDNTFKVITIMLAGAYWIFILATLGKPW